MAQPLPPPNRPPCPHCGKRCWEGEGVPVTGRDADKRGTVIYIVELARPTAAGLTRKGARKVASRRLAAAPVVYVGQTVLQPEERLHNHFIGHCASRKVRDLGLRLLDPGAEELLPGYRLPANVRAALRVICARSPEPPEPREVEVARLLRASGIRALYGL